MNIGGTGDTAIVEPWRESEWGPCIAMRAYARRKDGRCGVKMSGSVRGWPKTDSCGKDEGKISSITDLVRNYFIMMHLPISKVRKLCYNGRRVYSDAIDAIIEQREDMGND